jgi:hypothetical protein
METLRVTYQPRDPSNKPVGPYTESGINRDDIISKVCERIRRERPEINLEKDYNPQPYTEPV